MYTAKVANKPHGQPANAMYGPQAASEVQRFQHTFKLPTDFAPWDHNHDCLHLTGVTLSGKPSDCMHDVHDLCCMFARVTALNELGRSHSVVANRGKAISFVEPPTAPTDVRVELHGPLKFRLTWAHTATYTHRSFSRIRGTGVATCAALTQVPLGGAAVGRDSLRSS